MIDLNILNDGWALFGLVLGIFGFGVICLFVLLLLYILVQTIFFNGIVDMSYMWDGTLDFPTDQEPASVDKGNERSEAAR